MDNGNYIKVGSTMNIIRGLNFFGGLVCFFAHASAGLNATARPENSGLVVTGGIAGSNRVKKKKDLVQATLCTWLAVPTSRALVYW